ncbi:threonylcarbamoyladenosine tRNA methylthiotransferase MtaB [Hasllibacter halocynthiae]|uniref:Threonylcarbamoyladenosine tRNA methylthiotransferase MtaB n=1 Tax=Hasllibacter halocynthiae TaxID=595589 RepID=A0A2T0X1U0_9RHOB|nr:tRNA (N(6)-L-threonylcarbamoyladenosine(37)-C(2))-methylthiotransferase MtaB [Hasllibacter halocynthiae]PRY92916.1 threonylcarbamoyladenosine tRNA methylthiotransferase MtaB [Hasllibacter halocynthiae]
MADGANPPPVPILSNHGCRLNAAEAEGMRKLAADAGAGDAVIVNTCAVTAEAVRKSARDVRRMRKLHPGRRIVVTGCAAQIEPGRFAAMPEADVVLGNAEKMRPATWDALGTDRGGERVRVADIMDVRETAPQLLEGFGARTRAFVQVQNGCDHRCTFCVIPFGRGNSRSVPAGAVVEQVRRLAAGGHREVVLTGVDMTSWGADLPGRQRIGGLVRRVLKLVPELERLRISSIDSIEADADLMRALAEEERFMPHLHLSLQHGDDLILKRMKRRHGRKDALRFVEECRRLRPDVAFGADLIAGFPTETEARHRANLSLVREAGLTFLHVFPYSPRPGTPAARMPPVDGAAIRRRAAELRAEGARAFAAWADGQRGRRVRLLVEGTRGGRAESFAEIRLDRDAPPGEIVEAVVAGREGAALLACRAGGA